MILVNLALVLFNLTYVPLRQIYSWYLPAIVRLYDPVKGIEPHPVTERYLADIEKLRSLVAQSSLIEPSTQLALADLRRKSTTLIEENPFLASGQIASFSRLKQRMQQFTGAESAQEAFQQFWQTEYLMQVGWTQADDFLATKIEPLLQRNYFRETLPTGQYLDRFWRIDIFFVVFFGGELLLRTLIISRDRKQLGWGNALMRRWYELPLLLPFWRWLRLLPAGVRLHRTQLLNVEHLLAQITHEPAAYLSDRVSKFMIVQLINQAQTSIREGSLVDTWKHQSDQVQVGDPEKLDRITDRLVQLVVLRVMPAVKPDLEQLLSHSLNRALASSELYDGFQQIPGFRTLPDEALANIADYLAQATCDVLASSYTDQKGRVLLDQLSYDFRRSLGKELQTKTNSEELRVLLSDLLEEFKINYVQNSKQHDPEKLLQEVDNLQ